MSLLNNSNKNSKGKKKGGAAQKPAFSGNLKGKANSKSASNLPKLTGGAQRGS